MNTQIKSALLKAPDTLPLTEPGRQESAGQAPPAFLVPLLLGRQRAVFAGLCALWLLSLLAFWSWWLRPEHNVDLFRYALNCAVLFWTTVVPGYFVLIFARALISNPAQAVPTGLRVAMVVTKAPSEPFPVVRTTLLAMLSQAYPHDTWLADEDPSAETIDWCSQHGVLLSTRKNVAAYHNASWPRRTRCKEGNLAYFYDHYGYERYDFVAQLDADHVPAQGYLEAMLRPFADPPVGYVSAPSICDSNAASSWSARGRLYAEAALHGALQAGHNGGLAPLCIGSHYAVRTAALRDIGGLGPELAEDHSTTLIMNSKGWRGVHALDAIASGEGPRTFADMVTQEFQWSKSLAMLLLRYTPRYFGALPLRLKAQFLFAQLWYSLFSLTMAATVVMPVVALLTHRVWANVEYLTYLAYASAVTGSILLLMAWVKRTGCFRPCNAKVISWEGIIFLFARWPWSLLGIGSAMADCVRGREFVFRVTPKTAAVDARAPLRVVLPYLLISLFCVVPLLAVSDAGNARGFYVLTVFNGLMYFFVALLIVVAHARENGRPLSVARLLWGDGPLVLRALFLTTALVLAAGMPMRLQAGMAALLWRSDAELASAAEPIRIGVYDPGQTFSEGNEALSIEHIFVTLTDASTAAWIQDRYAHASSRGRQLMVTVEPWPTSSHSSATLLPDIVAGTYDKEIDAACASLRSLNAPVLVRWTHEMETPTGRYPWASTDAQGYIGAYRHFVDRCRGAASQMLFVWSPRGDPDLSAFFPGRNYVDYIGLSVFDCPTCGLAPSGRQHSAALILEEKYRRVLKYKLPVIVAELGVDGTVQRRREELIELHRTMSTLPMLKAVVYFNAPDTAGAWPWPHQPDWRITQPLLDLITAGDSSSSSSK
ncbi:MAG: glycosyltransferase family 2 protein [Polaromonas sp.]